MKPCRNDGKGCGYLSNASDHPEMSKRWEFTTDHEFILGPEENLKHRA